MKFHVYKSLCNISEFTKSSFPHQTLVNTKAINKDIPIPKFGQILIQILKKIADTDTKINTCIM